MDGLKEYATLTELMAGREPGSVKVRLANPNIIPSDAGTFRVGRLNPDGSRDALDSGGFCASVNDRGPWLLVSEDAPKLDTLRLEIAARVLAALNAADSIPNTLGSWDKRHAYALAEADALINEARRHSGINGENK